MIFFSLSLSSLCLSLALRLANFSGHWTNLILAAKCGKPVIGFPPKMLLGIIIFVSNSLRIGQNFQNKVSMERSKENTCTHCFTMKRKWPQQLSKGQRWPVDCVNSVNWIRSLAIQSGYNMTWQKFCDKENYTLMSLLLASPHKLSYQ